MQPSLGKIKGIGEIRDKDGNLKHSFEFETDATAEQAEKLGIKQIEEKNDGSNASDNS